MEIEGGLRAALTVLGVGAGIVAICAGVAGVTMTICEWYYQRRERRAYERVMGKPKHRGGQW